MKPTHHVIISLGFGTLLGLWLKSWGAMFACLLGGVFIDVDPKQSPWCHFFMMPGVPSLFVNLFKFTPSHSGYLTIPVNSYDAFGWILLQ